MTARKLTEPQTRALRFAATRPGSPERRALPIPKYAVRCRLVAAGLAEYDDRSNLVVTEEGALQLVELHDD